MELNRPPRTIHEIDGVTFKRLRYEIEVVTSYRLAYEIDVVTSTKGYVSKGYSVMLS